MLIFTLTGRLTFSPLTKTPFPKMNISALRCLPRSPVKWKIGSQLLTNRKGGAKWKRWVIPPLIVTHVPYYVVHDTFLASLTFLGFFRERFLGFFCDLFLFFSRTRAYLYFLLECWNIFTFVLYIFEIYAGGGAYFSY